MVDLVMCVYGSHPLAVSRGGDYLLALGRLCGGAPCCGPLPTRVSLVTVLRSPHVNKASREQFHAPRRGRRVSCRLTPGAAQVYLQLLEQSHMPGVEVHLTVTASHSFILDIYK